MIGQVFHHEIKLWYFNWILPKYKKWIGWIFLISHHESLFSFGKRVLTLCSQTHQWLLKLNLKTAVPEHNTAFRRTGLTYIWWFGTERWFWGPSPVQGDYCRTTPYCIRRTWEREQLFVKYLSERERERMWGKEFVFMCAILSSLLLLIFHCCIKWLCASHFFLSVVMTVARCPVNCGLQEHWEECVYLSMGQSAHTHVTGNPQVCADLTKPKTYTEVFDK